MRFLVVGAGVIGQAYAGRLSAAGHDVTLLARGERAGGLVERGIRLAAQGRAVTASATIITDVPTGEDYDYALLAVRFDQLHRALQVLTGVAADQVVTLCNLPDDTERLPGLLDRDRVVLGFPGIGGEIDDDGVVHYVDVRQQHTSVGRAGGAELPLARALRDARFPVDVVDDMPAWLTTHAVFITGVGAAIVLCDGDSAALGRSREMTTRMVAAIGDAFTALRREGIRPEPGPLRTIFTTVPRMVAVPYWQRQLRGPTGTRTIAPHIRTTRHTELPAIATATRRLLRSSAPAFDALLGDAEL